MHVSVGMAAESGCDNPCKNESSNDADARVKCAIAAAAVVPVIAADLACYISASVRISFTAADQTLCVVAHVFEGVAQVMHVEPCCCQLTWKYWHM